MEGEGVPELRGVREAVGVGVDVTVTDAVVEPVTVVDGDAVVEPV